MFKSKVLAAAAALTLAGGLGTAGVIAATAAHADTPLFTAATSISSNPDSGGNGNWAYDTYSRTLSVFADPGGCGSLAGFTSADTCYSATIADSGSFVTIPGAFQPNQGNPATGAKITSPSVPGTFAGGASYLFYAPGSDLPSASNVHLTVNDNFSAPSGENTTGGWFMQAFPAGDPSVRGSIDATGWSWTYKTGCETWTDAWNNGDGQSANLAADGNITGTVCPAPAPSPSSSSPPPPPPAVLFGDEVNPFGNGFDVFQQHARWNQPVVGWPATRHDPATHFLLQPEGSAFRLEYAPAGGGTGLCVSNPGDGLLVLRACNANVWQKFAVSGRNIISVVNGQVVNPDGTGAQLSTGPSPVPWGGSRYTFVSFASLPA